jgi:hypothetical protein
MRTRSRPLPAPSASDRRAAVRSTPVMPGVPCASAILMAVGPLDLPGKDRAETPGYAYGRGGGLSRRARSGERPPPRTRKCSGRRRRRGSSRESGSRTSVGATSALVRAPRMPWTPGRGQSWAAPERADEAHTGARHPRLRQQHDIAHPAVLHLRHRRRQPPRRARPTPPARQSAEAARDDQRLRHWCSAVLSALGRIIDPIPAPRRSLRTASWFASASGQSAGQPSATTRSSHSCSPQVRRYGRGSTRPATGSSSG